jgi:hypothetical protein
VQVISFSSLRAGDETQGLWHTSSTSDLHP